jgi:hypothetical protein
MVSASSCEYPNSSEAAEFHRTIRSVAALATTTASRMCQKSRPIPKSSGEKDPATELIGH